MQTPTKNGGGFKKYRVIFDTNVLMDFKNSNPATSLHLGEFKNYLSENKIVSAELFTTRASLLELAKQRACLVNGYINKINEGHVGLHVCGLSEPFEYSISDLESKLADKLVRKFEELGVGIIETISIPTSELLLDAINGKKPFRPRNDDRSENSDKGLKDMIIWRTAISLIQEGEHLIFVTENKKDFNQMDLQSDFDRICPKATFSLAYSFAELKEYLNAVFATDLAYENDVRLVDSISKQNIGDIMLFLHREFTEVDNILGGVLNFRSTNTSLVKAYYSVTDPSVSMIDDSDIIGYRFKEMILQDAVRDDNENVYRASISIRVSVLTKEESSSLSNPLALRLTLSPWATSRKPEKTFLLKLKINTVTNSIVSINKVFS